MYPVSVRLSEQAKHLFLSTHCFPLQVIQENKNKQSNKQTKPYTGDVPEDHAAIVTSDLLIIIFFFADSIINTYEQAKIDKKHYASKLLISSFRCIFHWGVVSEVEHKINKHTMGDACLS